MQDRIRIMGHVPSTDLPGFYQSASLFVWPSFFEGFGLPIVEALFSKCPVITSEGSVFPESGGEKTIYINPNKPELIKKAIKNVLESQSLRDEMIEAGYLHAQKFTLKNTTNKLNSFYQSIL